MVPFSLLYFSHFNYVMVWRSLDNIIEKSEKKYIRTSVGRIINELYYSNYKPRRFSVEDGISIHYKLGFVNERKYCRFYTTDRYIFDICGIPDRVVVEDKVYVDELKTTVSWRKGNKVIRAGLQQLNMYLYLTGAELGRLFVYYKDKQQLTLHSTISFNEKAMSHMLLTYAKIYELRKQT